MRLNVGKLNVCCCVVFKLFVGGFLLNCALLIWLVSLMFVLFCFRLVGFGYFVYVSAYCFVLFI